MSVFHENMLIGASGQAPAATGISRSIRLNAPDSAYLSRTPASAGNRKTWTWAGWVKPTKLGTYRGIFEGYTGTPAAGNRTSMQLANADQIDILFDNSSSGRITTTAVFRDPSAWYHIVFACDTTQATASNRFKLFINGDQVTVFSTASYPAQNYDTGINTTQPHYMGRVVDPLYADFCLADCYLIDGSALTPSSFTETDATTGQLIPKAFSGSYGSQGWHLEFADNSSNTATTLGKDTSGNSPANNWTPNNFSVTGGAATFAGSFDGSSSNYWTVNSNSVLDMGTGDFTVECWVRLNAMPTGEVYSSAKWIFGTGPANSITGSQLYIGQSNLHFDLLSDGSNEVNAAHGMTTNTWYHVAVTRSGTSIRGFINGQQKGSTTTTSSSWIGGYGWGVGASEAGSSLAANFNGQISNLRVIKGSALYTANFTPPSAVLTAVSGTSLLTLRSATVTDLSGNSLTVTSNGTVPLVNAYPFGSPADIDSLVDVPTNGVQTDTGAGGEVRGNYATLNPLSKQANCTLSNGNLDWTATSTGSVIAQSTIAISSGKWYCEFTATSVSNMFGLQRAAGTVATTFIGGNADSWGYYADNGNKYTNNSATSYGASYTTNDVIGVAFDADAGTLTFYKNGTSQGQAYSGLTNGPYTFATGNGGSTSAVFNAGARPFAYTAPSGFKALCTANLPAPLVTKPNTVFDVALYTANVSGGKTITLPGSFGPGLVWIKNRDNVEQHYLADRVRGDGSNKYLRSNSTNAEGGVISGDCSITFNANGFTLTDPDWTIGELYFQNRTYAAWCWDAGSSTVTNTQGSITSSVRANATAGFSVVTWSGVAGANGTIGHGLGVAPQMAILKNRGTTDNWRVYHVSVGATGFLQLASTGATVTSDEFQNTSPTSTVFYLRGNTWNAASNNYVGYFFAPVVGYSSFGSYTGNGSSTDGPFVYTGFRPRWVMVKRTDSTASWQVFDAARNTYNALTSVLFPNTADAEASNSVYAFDFISNGFKVRSSQTQFNASGGTYIYVAFAESPFNYSRAR